MKVRTIANYKIEVSEKAMESVPALAGKVKKEYNDYIDKAMHTKENNTYLTEKQQEAVNNGAPLEKYEKNIVNKINKTYKADEIRRLNSIFEEEKEVKRIIISTTWSRGSMGAMQCKAIAKVYYKGNDGTYNYEQYESRKTGGCGYDKESTATGEVLDQINALMKEFTIKANEAVEKGENYREYIGYGSGYRIVPYFEGGVGFRCHASILQKLGYTFNHLDWTKHSDVYEFIKE
jgi:hypothetical protein